MFENILSPDEAFTDTEAGFDAAGVNMELEEEEAVQELSMEDMLFEHFLDELVTKNKNSLDYQNRIKDQNTQALQQADNLRRRLGS